MGEFLKRMLRLFRSEPDMTRMGFLTSFFVTTPDDVVKAEFVELDIERTDEDVAPVLRDYKTGAVTINEDIYTNKQIKPPVYDLDRPVNIFDLMRKQPGETEYAEVGSWLARLMVIISKAIAKMTDMIRRGYEIQASQILQTGKLGLLDENGDLGYELDYRPKATHFPTAAVLWSNPTADPIGDISALAKVIRDDGLRDPRILIMNDRTYLDFISFEAVKDLVKQDYLGLGALNPRIVGKGGTYIGYVIIGSYRYEIFTYNATYVPFGGGTKTSYLADGKVIMLCDVPDLDFRLKFGDIPSIEMKEPFNQFVPERVTIDGIFDFHNHVYSDDKHKTYTADVSSRGICIPVSIDRYGCLTTR